MIFVGKRGKKSLLLFSLCTKKCIYCTAEAVVFVCGSSRVFWEAASEYHPVVEFCTCGHVAFGGEEMLCLFFPKEQPPPPPLLVLPPPQTLCAEHTENTKNCYFTCYCEYIMGSLQQSERIVYPSKNKGVERSHYHQQHYR